MPVDLTLTGHDKDLGGGFRVRRLLPAGQQQAVGPFLFFDHSARSRFPRETRTTCGHIRTLAWRR